MLTDQGTLRNGKKVEYSFAKPATQSKCRNAKVSLYFWSQVQHSVTYVLNPVFSRLFSFCKTYAPFSILLSN